MLTRSFSKKTVAALTTLSALLSWVPVHAQTSRPISWNDISSFRLDLTSIQPVPNSSNDFFDTHCRWGSTGVPQGTVDDFSPGPGYEFYQPTWERKTINTAHGALSLELPSPRSFNSRDYTWPDGRVAQHYSIVSNTRFSFGHFVRFPLSRTEVSSCGINRAYRLDVEKRSLKDIERIHNENVQAMIREGRLDRQNVLKPIRMTLGTKSALLLPIQVEGEDLYDYGKIVVEYKKGIVAHLSKETSAAYAGEKPSMPQIDLSLFRMAESMR